MESTFTGKAFAWSRILKPASVAERVAGFSVAGLEHIGVGHQFNLLVAGAVVDSHGTVGNPACLVLGPHGEVHAVHIVRHPVVTGHHQLVEVLHQLNHDNPRVHDLGFG